MPSRRCKRIKADGTRCRVAPLYESDYCFWHDPARAEDVHRARQAGGVRRRNEALVAGAYDLGDLSTPEGIQRLLDIAQTEAVRIENPVQKVRALNSIARTAILLLDTTDEHERLRLIKEVEGRPGRTH